MTNSVPIKLSSGQASAVSWYGTSKLIKKSSCGEVPSLPKSRSLKAQKIIFKDRRRTEVESRPTG